MKPACVSPEDIPPEALARKREELAEEAVKMGKPEGVTQRIVEGRLEKWISAQALLTQPYAREPEKTVGDLLRDIVLKVGENVVVRRFVRFEL
jgi:elongation factor Ts